MACGFDTCGEIEGPEVFRRARIAYEPEQLDQLYASSLQFIDELEQTLGPAATAEEDEALMASIKQD